MGVDLALLPFDADFPDLAFSHTILQVERDPKLWEQILSLAAAPVPSCFTSFLSYDACKEAHYGNTKEDCYGEHVQYVQAGPLAELLPDGPTKAYVAALSEETKVGLFWH